MFSDPMFHTFYRSWSDGFKLNAKSAAERYLFHPAHSSSEVIQPFGIGEIGFDEDTFIHGDHVFGFHLHARLADVENQYLSEVNESSRGFHGSRGKIDRMARLFSHLHEFLRRRRFLTRHGFFIIAWVISPGMEGH